jgi:glycosyltransferase involved in cell wall biosynthesis
VTLAPIGPRRIVFLDLARHLWGAEQSLFTLAASLRPLGVECTLVAWGQELADEWAARGLGDVVLLDAPFEHDRRSDLSALLRGRRLIPPADAFVFFSIALLPVIPVLKAMPRFRRTVMALDLHDTLEGSKGKALLRTVSRTVDAVIAVSEFTARQVSSPRPTVLLRPAVAPAQPAAAAGSNGPLTVGIIGRLDPAKQHLLAIHALSMTDAKVRLVVRGAPAFGDDAYLARLLQVAESSPYEILIEGRVAPEAALTGLDAVLVANPAEPMGRTAVEAQLLGLPVIVPDSGGAAELVEDGVTGLRFEAGIAGSLAIAYEKLAGDPELRARIGLQARETAIVRHDPTAYAAAFAAALARPRGRSVSASSGSRSVNTQGTEGPQYTVLHVVNAVSTGGAQTLIEAMAARRRPGQTLRLVVLANPSDLSDRLAEVFDSVDYLGYDRSSYAVHKLVRDLKAAVDRWQPDVIHSHLLHADLASLMLPRGRRTRISTVHTTGMTRDDPLRSRILGYVVGALARRFDQVVACDQTCLDWTHSMHYPPLKLTTIPNGVDISDAPAPGDPGPVLLSLSRWHPMKDHDNLFRAAAILRSRSVSFRLRCAGSGVTLDNPELVSSLAAAGVSELVEILGPSDDIPGLLRDSRAMVLSSAYGEAMPMAGLETIAAGRPVVTTDVGGCPTLVVDPAFVVPPENPERLADALQDLLCRSTEDWSALCTQSLELARSRFDIQQTVASYEKLYLTGMRRRLLFSRPAKAAPVGPEVARAAVVCLTPRGGHIEHAFNLASAIAAENGSTTVLISRKGAADYLPAKRDGVRVVEIAEFVPAPTIKDKIARTLRETNDVRHALSALSGLRLVVLEEPIMALAVPPSPRIQTVSVVHNVKDHDTENASLATRLRAGAKAVVLFRSRRVLVHGKEQGAAVPRLFARKVRVVELPGIGAFEEGHAGAIGASPLPEDVFVCLGEMRPSKNYEDAIRAAKASGQALVIAGAAVEQDYFASLQALVAELGAPVTFWSEFIDAGGFAGILATCRAAVVPYRFFAAQSGVLERGVAAGCPIISADLPALVEQAAGRPEVSFYPAGDVASLAALMSAAPSRVGSVAAGMESDPRWADLAGHALR